MKLDVDRVTKEVTNFLFSLQKPYWLRHGLRGGLNLKHDCSGCIRTQECYDCWVYIQFDDFKRLKLNKIQKKYNLCNNILWDVKRGKKKAEWEYIETEKDVDVFLRRYTGYGFWVEK